MKFGVRIMFVVFEMSLIIGQFFVALGSQINSIYLMILGRFIFGFGGESIDIAHNTILIKWFFKSQLSLPYGVALSLSRLGNAVSDSISPLIATKVIFFIKL